MTLEGKIIHGMSLSTECVSDVMVIAFGPIGSYVDLSGYYTKTEIDGKGYLTEHQDISGKADKATTYTKSEVDTALSGKQTTLVSGTNIKTINSQSLLGSGNINIQGGGGDMTNYYTKSETNSLLGAKQNSLSWDATPTEDSANPVTSGGLYTKFLYVEADLAGKANSADLASVATSGSYNDLSNKPSIPAAQVQSDWSQSDSSKVDYIKNKPTIPAAQVQADWNESDSSSKAYILNKPTVPDLSTYCPIIEDTRSSSIAAITGTAPFSSLADGQRIVLHFKYRNEASPTLQLTLSGGTTTSAIPLYQNYNNGVNALTVQAMPAGSFGEFVYDQSNSRWVLIGKDFNTTYSNTSQSDINNSAQGSRLIEPKLLRDNFYLKTEVNSAIVDSNPVIEDTRSALAPKITGVASFSTLVDKQRVTIHLAHGPGNSTTLELTLSDGVTTTGAIPVYARTYSGGLGQIADGHFRAGTYMELIYNSTQNRWYCLNLDRDTTTWKMGQSEINNSTDGDPRSVPTAKLLRDNFYLKSEIDTTIGAKADKVQEVEVTGATPTQTLASNTFYKFTGQVTSLTLTLGTPISGVTNIYGFSFTAGAANPTITWPQGCKLDGEPTIGAGDYFEATIQDGYVLYKIWKATT